MGQATHQLYQLVKKITLGRSWFHSQLVEPGIPRRALHRETGSCFAGLTPRWLRSQQNAWERGTYHTGDMGKHDVGFLLGFLSFWCAFL